MLLSLGAPMEQHMPGRGPPLSVVTPPNPFSFRRRSSSSRSYPATRRDVQRLSFKTALQVISPDTPGDSWDGHSTPNIVLRDGYFGKSTRMDSPSSPPSTSKSTPKSTPRATPRSDSTRRSPEDGLSTTMPTLSFDPPRPPREGFE
ncbi:hypothetical protein LX36DRAFT_748899 [Colletotrichum falcatum]|nr:hypothetical protein LX36DRAFT_748899 [Colletotrichum falcatum]